MKILKHWHYLVIIYLLTGCNSKNSIHTFSHLPVKSGEKWGYIDKEGKYTINPQFKEVGLFVDGLALVKTSNDKYGFIDEHGKFVINPIYKEATEFSEGLAIVSEENGHPTAINKKGEKAFVLKDIDACKLFKEGLAAVRVSKKWGFIDKNGKIVISPQFDAISDFKEGLCLFGMNEEKSEEYISSNTKFGFINPKGEIMIKPTFYYADDFSEGLAAVRLENKDDSKIGFIDKKGKIVINPQFDGVSNFQEGLALIRQKEDFGYIGKEGKIIINPQFKAGGLFTNGHATVKSSDGKWGIINEEGKYVVNPQFDNAGDYLPNDMAYVLMGSKVGLISKEGKVVVNPQFDEGLAEVWDLERIKNKHIFCASDFFDASKVANEIASHFLDGSFGSYNMAVTLEDILSDKVIKESDFEINSSFLQINDLGLSLIDTSFKNRFCKSDELSLSKLIFGFSSPTYNLVPTYAYEDFGYYTYRYSTGNKKIYNFSSKLERLYYAISLDGRAKGKEEMLCEALKSALVIKLNAKEDKDSAREENAATVLKSNLTTVVLKKEDDVVSIRIVFEKNEPSTIKSSASI